MENILHTFVVSFHTALAHATSQGLANPFLSLVQRFLKLFCFRFFASILYFIIPALFVSSSFAYAII
jgi:hypothetical protein